MPFRIELGPDGNANRTLDASDIISVDVAKPHTAVADFDAEIPFDRAIRDRVLDRCRIYGDGDLLFRGYMRELDWDQKRGTVRLNGPGIADDLRDSAIERSWTNTATHVAIREVWNQDTGFDATVRDPNVSTIADGKTIIDASSQADLQAITSSVSATDPAYVDGNGDLRLAQTCFLGTDDVGTGEIADEKFSGEITLEEDGEGLVERGYIGGSFGEEGDSMEFSFDVDYTMPASDVVGAMRYLAFDDSDDGNDSKLPGLRMELNGERMEQFADGFQTTGFDEIGWIDGQRYEGGDIKPEDNPHTFRLRQTDPSDDTYDEYWIGLMGVYDDRFSYNFDNNVKNSGDDTVGTYNYLNGPELYPQDVVVRFDQYEAEFNVIGIDLSTDGWTDTGADQAVAISFDGGSTWLEASNATSISEDQPGNVGATVDYRVTLDRYPSSPDRERTPAAGYQGQRLGSVTVDYDGSDLSIIQDNTFRGSPLKIQQDLHDRADYRFAIDHTATDGNGDPTKVVESFETGDQSRAVDWTVVNRSPRLSFVGYANEVTIYGELKADGTRPKVTVEDSDEVQNFGREPFFAIRPDLTTVDQVRSAAIDVLAKKVRERSQKGTVSVLPTDILPGYSYPVDWFADGDDSQTPLERVQYQESADQMRGTLKFVQPDDVTETVIEQGRSIVQTREGI